MIDTKNPPQKHVTACAPQLAPRVTLKSAYVRFPSYLHIFDIFFQHSHGGLGKGVASSYAGFSKRFPTWPIRVAIV
jgi:hypothetical protein